ncbi:MAG: MarR family winged helix-turn-helix transcriptional regulator [Streptosporangiaceae bacterium]
MTSPTRWLTAEEQRCWRLLLNACQSLFGAVDTQLLKDSGLPHGYYEVLVHLSEAPDRSLRMSQLAAASTFSKSRLSHAVARLEERGLVTRRDCPTDRRGQIAQLTDAGYAVLSTAAPGHVEQVRRSLIDALTDEQVGQLIEISEAIIAASPGGRSSGCPDSEPGCTEPAADCGDAERECADAEAGCAEPGADCAEAGADPPAAGDNSRHGGAAPLADPGAGHPGLAG